MKVYTYSNCIVTFLVLRSKNLVVLSMDVVIILSSSGANITLVMVLACKSTNRNDFFYQYEHRK